MKLNALQVHKRSERKLLNRFCYNPVDNTLNNLLMFSLKLSLNWNSCSESFIEEESCRVESPTLEHWCTKNCQELCTCNCSLVHVNRLRESTNFQGQYTTESQNVLCWKRPQRPSSSNSLPWEGLPPTGLKCLGPHSTWPWKPPGMRHPQFLGQHILLPHHPLSKDFLCNI